MALSQSKREELAYKIAEFTWKMRELSKIIKEQVEQHSDYNEMKQLKKKVKEINNEIKSDPAIEPLFDERKELTEQLKLIKEILIQDMNETWQKEIDLGGGLKVIRTWWILIKQSKK